MNYEIGYVPKGGSYQHKSDEVIREIAQGMYRGEIFTSMQISGNTSLEMVFMPLIFMNEMQLRDIQESNIVHFFAYMSEAMPRSINGNPIFSSCYMLNQTDTNKVIEKYNSLKEAVENA